MDGVTTSELFFQLLRFYYCGKVEIEFSKLQEFDDLCKKFELINLSKSCRNALTEKKNYVFCDVFPVKESLKDLVGASVFSDEKIQTKDGTAFIIFSSFLLIFFSLFLVCS